MATPGGDDEVELEIVADGNDAQIGAESERIGRLIGNRMDKGLSGSKLGKSVPDIMAEALKGKSGLEGLTRGARQLENAGKQMGDTFSRRLAEMRKDFEAVEARAEATRNTLRKAGADENLFAVTNRQLRITQSAFRDLEEEIQRGGTLGEERFERLARILKESNATIQRDTAGIQSTLRTFTNTQTKEQQRLNDEQNRTSRERLAQQTQANSRFIVAEQGAFAESLATQRTAGRLQVAEAQSAARRRIEILRFAFRQIQQLERGIAGVFRASGTVIRGAAGAIGSGVNRISGLLRRSNRDMNDGLAGALNQRERALSRSFRRQTSDVNTEINRQQRAVDKFDRQVSTGVLGALSGRGRFGAAFGAASLVGGGFTAANLFTAGLDRFQSLERANLQLTRMLGSAQAARQQLDELDNWARGTPLALDLVTQIAVGLLSMGTAADQVLPRLQAITDAVAFTGGGADEIQRVSLAIRQIASAGRLLGQDFNQIAQSLPGLNLAQLLADQLTGGDTAAFLKLRESGEISAQQFVEAFVAGVNANDAIGGSTASLASTLQGQISNLNAAWRRLGAAFITQFEGPLRTSIRRLRDNLSLFAKFVTGDVNPTLLALRGAIAGVGVALGGLIAVKAAAETLQLLGVAARFALTPLGGLITIVVAIAAATGALRVANDNFRYITDGIRNLAAESLVRGVGLLGAALRRFGRFLIETVVPGLARLGQAALPVLITAVRVLVAIFNALLIPAVRAGFGYLVDTAIPAAVNLAAALRQYLIPAVIALGAAWFVVNTPLTTVVATFAAVGAALLILRANSEAVRGFTDDLAQSFVNLGSRLAGIGRTVGGVAADAFGSLSAALGDLLSGIDYRALAVRVLGFVNTLGRLLGSAITSRLAVTAGVAVGATAVALAGAFLVGFAEGVVKGLPGAIDQIIDLIRIGLEEAGLPGIVTGLFSNAFTGIGALIVAAILVSSVLRSLTGAGSRAAAAFSGGFGSGIRRGFTATFRGLEGFRFPTTAIQAQARDQAVAFQREFDRIMRNNRRLGAQSALVTSGAVSRDALDATALRRLNAEQQRFIQGADQATIRAVLFRRTWGDALRDTGNRWQAVQDRVAQTGGWAAVGQRAGVLLVTGFAAAIAGSQGGTAGLVGVVSASLGGLALGGPIVGGLTALVGSAFLLHAELTKTDEVLKAIEERTSRLRDLFRDIATEDFGTTLAENLSQAALSAIDGAGGDAAATLSILPDGFFARAAGEIERGEFELDAAFSSLAQRLGLNTEQINAILELGPAAYLDLIAEATSGSKLIGFTQDQAEAFAALGEGLSDAGASGEGFAAVLTSLQVESQATRDALADLEEERRLLQVGLSTVDVGFFADIEARAGGAARALGEAGEELTTWGRISGQLDAVRTAFGRVTGVIDQLELTGVNVFEAVKQELESTGFELDDITGGALRRMIDGWLRAGLASDQAQRFMRIDAGIRADWDAMAGRVADFGKATGDTSEELEEAAYRTGLLTDAVDELNKQRTERLRGQIDTLRNGLELAEGSADRARRALTDFLTGSYADSAQAQVDALIGNIGSIGSRIEEGLLQGGIRGNAAARAAVGDFGSQIAGIVNAAIEEGITSGDQLRGLLSPLFGALDEEAGDGLRRILSTVDVEEGITREAAGKLIDELNRVLGGADLEARVQGVFAADAEVARIQRQLDRLEADLDVKVHFDEDQVRQALRDAGASRALVDDLDWSSLDTAQLSGLVAAVAAATAVFGGGSAAGGSGSSVQTNDIDFNFQIVSGAEAPVLASEIIGRANAAVTGVTTGIRLGGGSVGTVNPRLG